MESAFMKHVTHGSMEQVSWDTVELLFRSFTQCLATWPDHPPRHRRITSNSKFGGFVCTQRDSWIRMLNDLSSTHATILTLGIVGSVEHSEKRCIVLTWLWGCPNPIHRTPTTRDCGVCHQRLRVAGFTKQPIDPLGQATLTPGMGHST